MVSYQKKINKDYYIKMKRKKSGSRLEVACCIAQPIQSISTQIGLDWLLYLAANPKRPPGFFLFYITLSFKPFGLEF
jgi:hypothetical protein